MVSGGDRPKTQKSILKVEDSIQYTTIERDNVVPENNLVIHSNVKVENDDQSKLVFRQPGGGVWCPDFPDTRPLPTDLSKNRLQY